jgi:DNA-binding NarL/FixJ family response regulator
MATETIVIMSEESLADDFVFLRILVADNGSSVNDGLTALLSELDGISVFGCAQDPGKLLALARSLRPDVVILDIQCTKPISLAILHRLKALPCAPIIIALCENGLQPIQEAVLAGGADHVFLKTDCEKLLSLLAGMIAARSRP